MGRDACDIEKDQEMALSAVGGDQAEGRLGPGRAVGGSDPAVRGRRHVQQQGGVAPTTER